MRRWLGNFLDRQKDEHSPMGEHMATTGGVMREEYVSMKAPLCAAKSGLCTPSARVICRRLLPSSCTAQICSWRGSPWLERYQTVCAMGSTALTASTS